MDDGTVYLWCEYAYYIICDSYELICHEPVYIYSYKYWEFVMQILLKGFYIGWFDNIGIINAAKTKWKATHILSYIESPRLNPSRRLYYIKSSNEIVKLKSNEPALRVNKFVE